MTCTARSVGRRPYCENDGAANLLDAAGAKYGLLGAGTVIYVDGGHANASDDNIGTNPDYPKATIAGGLAAATDGAGDVVLIAPGTYNPTAAITVSKENVIVMGMPIGGNPMQPENGVVVYPAASYATGPTFIPELSSW